MSRREPRAAGAGEAAAMGGEDLAGGGGGGCGERMSSERG